MAAPRLDADELPGPGDPDALLGPLVGLHLRHAGLTLLLAPPRPPRRMQASVRAPARGPARRPASGPVRVRLGWWRGAWWGVVAAPRGPVSVAAVGAGAGGGGSGC